jgi:hypothetical protein
MLLLLMMTMDSLFPKTASFFHRLKEDNSDDNSFATTTTSKAAEKEVQREVSLRANERSYL